MAPPLGPIVELKQENRQDRRLEMVPQNLERFNERPARLVPSPRLNFTHGCRPGGQRGGPVSGIVGHHVLGREDHLSVRVEDFDFQFFEALRSNLWASIGCFGLDHPGFDRTPSVSQLLKTVADQVLESCDDGIGNGIADVAIGSVLQGGHSRDQ